jgi:hypothetical protein
MPGQSLPPTTLGNFYLLLEAKQPSDTFPLHMCLKGLSHKIETAVGGMDDKALFGDKPLIVFKFICCLLVFNFLFYFL